MIKEISRVKESCLRKVKIRLSSQLGSIDDEFARRLTRLIKEGFDLTNEILNFFVSQQDVQALDILVGAIVVAGPRIELQYVAFFVDHLNVVVVDRSKHELHRG